MVYTLPKAILMFQILSVDSLLQGADAAEKVFERDAKRLGNQARNKASQAAGKAKKVTKKARR